MVSNLMWRTSEISGYAIRATDGPIGSISDLLFDDHHWALRWAVVDTGNWLPGRLVLLPPSVLGRPDTLTREFPVDLSRERIEAAPGLEADAPVSRQIESQIYSYYDWSPYWMGGSAIPSPHRSPAALRECRFHPPTSEGPIPPGRAPMNPPINRPMSLRVIRICAASAK